MTLIFTNKTDEVQIIIYLEYMTPILTKIQSVCCSECLAFPSTSDWQLVQTRRQWVSKRHTAHNRINERPTLGLFPTRVLHSTNNNGSPTPLDVRGDSSMDPSMDPSSSRAHRTEPKYIDKDCFSQSYTCFILLIYKISHKQLGGFLFD